MKKSYLWIIIILIAAVVGGLALRYTARVSSNTGGGVQSKLEPPPAAVVSEVQGEASVTRSGKTLAAFDLMKLEAGDRIEVGATGTLVILWPSYGRSVLKGGTVVILKTATLSQDKQTLNVRIQLETGRIWTRLKKLLGPDSSFGVRASSVVATVRGTSFGVSRQGPRVEVQVIESTVRVMDVRDRELTPQEAAGGIVSETVEEPIGSGVDVSERQEIEYDPVKAISIESMLTPREMTPQEIADPFVQEGHADIPPAELEAPQYLEAAPTSVEVLPEPVPPPEPVLLPATTLQPVDTSVNSSTGSAPMLNSLAVPGSAPPPP